MPERSDPAIYRFGRTRTASFLEILRQGSSKSGQGIAGGRQVVHPVNAMDRPVQVELAPDQRRRARRRAAEQGLTLSAYVARLVEDDLASWAPEPGTPVIIPIGVDLPTDHVGSYIGEAVAARLAKPPESDT